MDHILRYIRVCIWLIISHNLSTRQEKLTDLLCDAKDQCELKIRNDSKAKGLYVEGLTQKQLATEQDYAKLIERGTSRRKVAETNMNAVSSRSHAILTITIESYSTKKDATGGNAVAKVLLSRSGLIMPFKENKQTSPD